MIRKLLIVFASGLALSIALLGSAWIIGGAELMERIEKEGGVFILADDAKASARTTRTFAYDGSQILRIAIPVDLRFTRGDAREMRVSGRAETVEGLRFENGRLSSGKETKVHKGALTIEITAPGIAGLDLAGAGDIRLDDLDQESLKISSRGAIDLIASGQLRTLSVRSAGAGDLDFRDVDLRDARIETRGAGDIDLSATGNVDAIIAGAGEVTLHRKPDLLTSRVSGVGSINHAY